MKSIACIFSGQGAQHVSMGHSLYQNNAEIKHFWDQSDSILGESLSNIVFNGPEESLTRTRYCQPALYVHGYSIYKALIEPKFASNISTVFGLSLGELTALAAAQVVDFETGLQLVRKRGLLMEDACNTSEGAMVCLIGATEDAAQALANESGIDIANLNCPDQIVLSGASDKVALAQENATASGQFKKVVPLNVAGAYHSRLMESAAQEFARFIEDIPFAKPQLKLFSNVDGLSRTDPDDIKQSLVDQIHRSVRFTDCVQNATQANELTFIECGPGNVLQGLLKRIDRALPSVSISELNHLPSLDSLQLQSTV